jgi:hypothetical protein
MQMSLEQYIQNPIGKQSAVLSAIVREAIQRSYTEKFNNLMLRENGLITYYKYKTKNNEFIIHIKIPSETVKKFYYDTVFKFYADSSITDLGRSINKYYFKAYSNDPAFVYTHCFVFYKNELFIEELKNKMSREALTKAPTIKNPNQEVAYCKTLFFAYLFMKNRGLFNRLAWNDAEDFDIKRLSSNIMNADEKIAQCQEEGAKIEKKKQILVDQKTAKALMHNKHLSEEEKARIVTSAKVSSKTNFVKKTKAVNSISSKRSNRK